MPFPWPRLRLPRPSYRLPDLHMESVRASLRFGALAAVLAFLASLVVPYVGVFQKLELTTQDVRMRLRGERPLDPSIALIEIDEPTLKAYNNSWPISRDQYALLLSALRDAGAKSVGIDLLFVGDDKYKPEDPATPTNDAILAAVIARDSAVVNGVYFPLLDPNGHSRVPDESLTVDPLRASWLRFTAPLPAGIELVRSVDMNFEMQEDIAESTAAVGHVSLYQDLDGVVRSVPLVVNHQGRMFPSLALLMAARQRDADWRQIRFSRGLAILPTPHGALRIPVDNHARMLISFPGNRDFFRRHVNRHEFVELMQEIVGSSEAGADGAPGGGLARLEGSVALVCNTAATSAISDFGPTPFDVNFPLAYAHASVVNSILRGDHLRRVPRDVQVGFWALTALVLAFVMSTVSPIPFLVVTVIGIFAYMVVGWASAAFTGSIIEIVPPMVMIGLQAVAIGARGYRLRDRQRRAQEQELAVAKKIQQDLLPRGVLAVDGVEVAGFNLPCYAVGGDYFDYFRLPDGRHRAGHRRRRRQGRPGRAPDVEPAGHPAGRDLARQRRHGRSRRRPTASSRESMSGSSKFVTFFYGALRSRHAPAGVHQRRPQPAAGGARRRPDRGARGRWPAAGRLLARHLRRGRGRPRVRAMPACCSPTASPRPRTRRATCTATSGSRNCCAASAAARRPPSRRRSRTTWPRSAAACTRATT